MRFKYSILDEDLLIFDTTNDTFLTLKNYLFKFLTLPEQEKIESYKNEVARIVHTISFTIPKIELAKVLNVNPKDIVIIRNENEKPYFKDYPMYHYSVSHSNSYVGFVLSKNQIGLDIEQRVNRDFKALNFVSTSEEIEECKDNDDKYALWTFKEAYAKYCSKGLGKYLKDIHTSDSNIVTNTIYINHLVISLVKSKN